MNYFPFISHELHKNRSIKRQHCLLLILTVLSLWLAGSEEILAVPAPTNDNSDQVGRFSTRSKLNRLLLFKKYGGDVRANVAIQRGLEWISLQQQADGSWSFDGTCNNELIAATGICLLPFLAEGYHHKKDSKYKNAISKGLDFLKQRIDKKGHFKDAGNYAQPMAAMALCEAAGMAEDPELLPVAQLSIDYIVSVQGDNGSWGYKDAQNGDTSITGWNIQALRSASLAGLKYPKKTLENARLFLNFVADDGGTYGYSSKSASVTMTAVGIVCQQFMSGEYKSKDIVRGLQYLLAAKPKAKDWNIYFLYYATPAMLFHGEKIWEEWNLLMKELILNQQITVSQDTTSIGKWNKDRGIIGNSCGSIGTTAMSLLTLQAYYRYPIEPIIRK